MKLNPLDVAGAYLVEMEPIFDDRGYFARNFCQNELSSEFGSIVWVQGNTSFSKETGTLRGLHFQLAPSEEIKYVRCTSGAVWDVVVDMRPSSDTYLAWTAVTLSADTPTGVIVPKGCAHGFLTLEKNSCVDYLVSEFYNPALERTLIWSDRNLKIAWPSVPSVISRKDLSGLTVIELQDQIRENSSHKE